MEEPTSKNQDADLASLFPEARSGDLSRSSSCSDKSDCSSGTEAASLRHMKVAEAAVTGWEKATAESMALKLQLEQALQQKQVSDRKAARLDLALKESIRELRRVREEQAQRIRDAVAEKKEKWDKQKADLEGRLQGCERQVAEANAEMEAMVIVLEDRASVIQDMEKEADRLMDLLKRAEAARVKLEEQLVVLGDDSTVDRNASLKDGGANAEACNDEGAEQLEVRPTLEDTVDKAEGKAALFVPKGEIAQADFSVLEQVEAALKISLELAIAERGPKEFSSRELMQRCSESYEVLSTSVDNVAGEVTVEDKLKGMNQTSTCSRCQQLLNSLSRLQEDLTDADTLKHSSEEAVGLLEGELGKLSSRLNTAERASGAAEREAMRLKEELSLAKEEMDRLSQESRELRTVYEGSIKEAAEQDCKQQALSEHMSGLTKRLQCSEDESEQLAAELTAAYAENARLRSETEHLSRSLEIAKRKDDEDVEEMKERCAKLTSELAEAEGEIENLKKHMWEMQAQGSRAEKDLEEALATANQTIARVSAELAQSRQETADVGEELANVEEMVGQLSEGLTENENLKAELTSAHAKVEELSAELSSWREQTAGLQKSLSAAHSAMQDLSNELGGKDDVLAELTASNKRIAELSAELAQWRNDTISLGSELSWAKNRIAELADAESEAARLRSQLHSSKTKITDANEALMSADADKQCIEEEFAYSRAILAEVAEQAANQAEDIAALEAELLAVKQGDFTKARELETRRLTEKSTKRNQELGQTVNGDKEALVAAVVKERKDVMQELHELRVLKDDLTSELSLTSSWTSQLETRLEDEGRAREQMQAEVSKLRNESATLSSRLVAATERASMLEASLMETEARVAEVRRSLVAMHKEKLTADMELAVANAARAELGARLDAASNEVNALSAKLAAAMEEGFDRERREELRLGVSQDASGSMDSGSSRGRTYAHKDFHFLQSSKRQTLSHLSGSSPHFVFGKSPPQTSPRKQPASDSSLAPPVHQLGPASNGHGGLQELGAISSNGEDSVDQVMAERLSPSKGKKSESDGLSRSRLSRRSVSPRRSDNPYYNSPAGRRPRSRGHSPPTFRDIPETASFQQPHEVPLVGEKRNVASALEPVSLDVDLVAPSREAPKPWPVDLEESLDKAKESPTPSASSQGSLSPSLTPPSVLPQASGNRFFGPLRRSSSTERGSMSRKPLKGNATKAMSAGTRSSSFAGFLGRSKRVKADAPRES